MTSSSLAAPYVFEANGGWTGNDGNWSAFSVGIGSPPQYFGLYPSTVSSEIWVPDVQACAWSPSWLDCGAQRGVQAPAGPQSQGFESNISTTWDLIGIYDLATENNLYGSKNDTTALYGEDTVTLRSDPIQTIPKQLVAGIITASLWLGSLGLGSLGSSFSVRAENPQSLLFSMKSLGIIPSLSYGYTAGAWYSMSNAAYESSKANALRGTSLASLIAGGYDAAAFTPSGLQFAVDRSNGNALPVTLKGLFAVNSPSGTLSAPIPSAGLEMAIDSTVSQLWLPPHVCDALAVALGLTFDPATELYTVNDSAHQQLLQSNPQFTLTLTTNSSSEDSTNVVFPYAAFDQRAYLPFYNVSTPYFPIRRAANESQFVLGRTFLQEAYVVVDWERGNFTLGQAIHFPRTSKAVLIPPFELTKKENGIGSKEIVGIAVGAVAGILILALLAWMWMRSSRKRRVEQVQAHTGDQSVVEQRDVHEMANSSRCELRADTTKSHELGSTDVFEMFEERLYQHLTSSQVFELNARRSVQELEGNWI